MAEEPSRDRHDSSSPPIESVGSSVRNREVGLLLGGHSSGTGAPMHGGPDSRPTHHNVF